MNDVSAARGVSPRFDPSGRPPKGRSTRAHLLALSLVLLVPVLTVAAVLAYGLARVEQDRFERSGQEAVRGAVLAVELEMRGLTRALEGLAASPSLLNGELDEFYAHARATAAVERTNIALRDASSRNILSTLVPYGQPLPQGTRLSDTDREAVRTRRPAVSDYFSGLVDGRSYVGVVVPIVQNDAVVGLLSASLPIDRLREILRAQAGGLWRLGLLDRGGVAITRVSDPDIPGQRPPTIGAAAARSDRGYFEMISTEGAPSAVSFAKTSWGWTLLAVASIGEYRATQRNAVGFLVIGGLGLIALGIGSALLIARRISEPMRSLETAARRLSRGEPVAAPAFANLEANTVGQALAESSEALRLREAELASSRARYKNLFDSMDEGFFIVGLIRDAGGAVVDYRFLDVNPAFERLTGLTDVVGRRRREVLPDEDTWWFSIYDRVATTGESARFEYLLRVRGRWFDIHATPLPGARDQVAILSDDITERKRAEQLREFMINELNHRVKNTLTAVQSLAMQSLRTAGSLDEGREAFLQRLMALSRAHNVLTQESWEGAGLREIVAEAVGPFRPADPDRFRTEGPDLRLSPKAALALSMALHELCTNALKHGALAAESGRIALDWRIDGDALAIAWRESGGPPVEPPKRRGFGTRLIERSLRDDLGAELALSYPHEGFRCEIRVGVAAATTPEHADVDAAQAV